MIFLLAVALSIDALGIGVSYSVRGIKIPMSAKFIICALSIIITAVSILMGKSIALIFPPLISKIFGALLLIAMGIWIIVQGMKKDDNKDTNIHKDDTILNIIIKSLGITIKVIRNPLSCDLDNSSRLDPLEAIYMGIALSLDSVGVGIGSGIAGLGSMFVPILAGLFQMIFLSFGQQLGKWLVMFKKIDNKIWVIISGCLLVFLAIFRIL